MHAVSVAVTMDDGGGGACDIEGAYLSQRELAGCVPFQELAQATAVFFFCFAGLPLSGGVREGTGFPGQSSAGAALQP